MEDGGMDFFKFTVALLSIGFSCGVAYTVACGNQNPHDAHADTPATDTADPGHQADSGGETDTAETDSTAPPAPPVSARVVLVLETGTTIIDEWNTYYGEGGDQPTIRQCWKAIDDGDPETSPADCCPAGFSMVGSTDGYPGSEFKIVCLED